MNALHDMIVAKAKNILPREGEASLRKRQRSALNEAQQWISIDPLSREASDLILLAERLRLASVSLGQLTGGSGVESMLDALFGRFCIGK
jgi:tRNA modification GTPase